MPDFVPQMFAQLPGELLNNSTLYGELASLCSVVTSKIKGPAPLTSPHKFPGLSKQCFPSATVSSS